MSPPECSGTVQCASGQGTPATVFCQPISFQASQLALSSASCCASWIGEVSRGVMVFHSLLAVVAEGCPDKELHGMQKAVVLGKVPWCPSEIKPMVEPELDLTQIHPLFMSFSIFLCQTRVAATAEWLLAHRVDATQELVSWRALQLSREQSRSQAGGRVGCRYNWL